MFETILTNIRERLLTEFSGKRFRSTQQEALGVGASGDRTFPVDKVAEEIILSELDSSGLPLSIISEESGTKELRGGGLTVLIDPVDGSKNAISGIPFYGTSIAVAEGTTIGSITMASVINLVTGDEFRSEKGKGAYLNAERIHPQRDDRFSLIAYEAPAPGTDIAGILPVLSRAHKTRCLGATALDLAYLAYGSISVFLCPSPSRSFDFGGGWLLVREAGGTLTDIRGNSIEDVPLGLAKSTSLLASANRQLHERVLMLLTG